MNEADFNEDRPNARCDYSDWQFESINFKWIPKIGHWIMYGYDLNEVFDGTIERRPLTRCVCGDSQFTHYMIEDGKKTPLLCPICEPEPTTKPPVKMVEVFDMWEQDENGWGNEFFIHTTICDKVRELKMFKDHPQRQLYPHEYDINEDGWDQVGENMIGCQSREQEDSWTEIDGEYVENKDINRQYRIREAKTFAVCQCMKNYI